MDSNVGKDILFACVDSGIAVAGAERVKEGYRVAVKRSGSSGVGVFAPAYLKTDKLAFNNGGAFRRGDSGARISFANAFRKGSDGEDERQSDRESISYFHDDTSPE